MKFVIASLVAAAAANVAYAEPNTQFRVELSQDGVTWTQHLDLRMAGAPTVRVFARSVVSYIQNDGPVPLFMNGTRHQPTVHGWNSLNDELLPFEPRFRIEATYGAVPRLGRTFGQSQFNGDDILVSHTNGSVLRFAATSTTNAIGVGSGRNNVNGHKGINTSNNPGMPNLFITDVPLFTWGMDLTLNGIGRNLLFDIPYGGIKQFRENDESQGRGADWVIGFNPFAVVRAPVLPTITALLTIPAPNSAAALGMAVFFAARRRRC